MTNKVFYIACSDDEHDQLYETTTSLFEATCIFYKLLPDLTGSEVAEIGELLNHGTDNEEMEGFKFSND